MSSNSSLPAWKRQLYVNKAQALLALDSENFTFFQIRHALRAQPTETPEQVFISLGGNSGTVDNLKDLNISNAMENETAFAQYKQDTEDLKGEKDQQVWKQKMEERKNATKKRVNAAIDATYDAAADVIDQLPPSEQESAFNIFDLGQQWVMNAFETLVDQMKKVIGYIVDFIKGVWTAMQTAWTTVRNAVSTAVNFIKGIFSAKFGQTGNAEDDNNNKNNNTMDVALELSWKNSPPIHGLQAAASVDYLHNSIKEGLKNEYLVHITEPVLDAGSKN
ncbi:hypothetical protein K4K60_005895 [Colletotrichum sp. SAR11_57]|nr:hypothetical protein K4K60_005895 [Colletotrichum sp. SAR11_57]